MSDKHPIRNSVIASVIAGVILAGLGLLWPPKALFGRVWSVLSTSVTLPVWVFVVGVAAAVGSVIALRRALARAQALDSLVSTAPTARIDVQAAQTGLPVGSEPEEPEDGFIVSKLEVAALKRIAKEDDAPLYLDTLKRSLGITNIRCQAVVDRLIELDLVEADEQEVFLTAKGREFVLAYRLAR